LGLQLFDEKFADKFAFDVLDPTKIVPEEEVPVRRVGRLVLDRTVDNFFAETEQVAFCTQNIIPGVDFTNDPLLQGRNFSYLDTQLKRLGGPNFSYLPVNAPKCPIAHFQQDGHMAVSNPVTRANYEPNSWEGDVGGPREDPGRGFVSYPAEVTGAKRRLRAESFADHFSQPRQFYLSQSPVEQAHICEAFVFELSKCRQEDIRARMVGVLRNVDEDLARHVSKGIGLERVPPRSKPARQRLDTLAPSPALSILYNGPQTFAGRKLGVLVTNGADHVLLRQLRDGIKAANASLELVAPTIAGISDDASSTLSIDQTTDGGPSVLYDAVAIVVSDAGGEELAKSPAARDFVTDAYAHCKFVGYVGAASPLFESAGLAQLLDGGFVDLESEDVTGFLSQCQQLRFWERATKGAGA
jgi:catalase